MNRDLGRNIILAAGRSSSDVQSILKQVCLSTPLILNTYLIVCPILVDHTSVATRINGT